MWAVKYTTKINIQSSQNKGTYYYPCTEHVFFIKLQQKGKVGRPSDVKKTSKEVKYQSNITEDNIIVNIIILS